MAKKRSGLVRDKFPELFTEDNDLLNTIQLDDEEYRKALAEKIVEESKHLIDTVAKDESATSVLVILAEIEDLSHTLLGEYRLSEADLGWTVRYVNATQGGFRKRLVLESIKDFEEGEDNVVALEEGNA
jgi:predicted house-cleaning noncanonical NTP pyrophosphatase (MazG superfamily)